MEDNVSTMVADYGVSGMSRYGSSKAAMGQAVCASMQ